MEKSMSRNTIVTPGMIEMTAKEAEEIRTQVER